MPRLPNRKWIAACLAFVLLFGFTAFFAAAEKQDRTPTVSARAAALYLPETKTFLYKKSSDIPLPMASTTKMMTAIVAIENGDPDAQITVPKEACGIEGSSLYLAEGETLSLRGLLYGLLLRSANDAACAIACSVGGDVASFVAMMNEKAEALGLSGTHFDNPHGLPASGHFSTAEDLAKIAAYGLSLPLFREITATEHIRIRNSEGLVRLVRNHNKLLDRYEGTVGVKTGYTKESGRCLVSAAERGGILLVAVTLDAPDDWADHEKLLDAGFSSTKKTTLCEPGEIRLSLPVIGGEKPEVTLENPDGLTAILRDPDAKITRRMEALRYRAAPISEGEVLAEAVFYADGEEIGRIPLCACESIAKKKGIFRKTFR